MRRPILISQAKTETKLQVNRQVRTTVALQGVELEKRLREKRSAAYLETLRKLDGGGAMLDRQQIEQLLQAITDEFPELQPYQFPVGIVAKCYLGEPYEVHSLNVMLEIIEHYKRGTPLPSDMEKGRSLAMHPAYEFIEIYSDCMCAVSHNGTVSIIRG